MTLYDAAMIGAVILGMIWGAWRGITWQVASIASLVVGYLVASPASAQLASHFPGEPVVARSLALMAVYAAVSGGIFLAAWIVRATLRRLRFEAYDRHLGMILGGLEGALLGIVATLFVVSLAPQTREPIFASPSGRLVGHVMDAIGPALPGEVRQVLTPFWSESPPNSRAIAETDTPSDRDSFGLRSKLSLLGDSASQAVESTIKSGDPESPSLDKLIDEGRSRIGRAAGQALEDQLQQISPDGSEELSGFGRSAGRALENSIESGETSGLRGLIDEGRARLGRAAGRALQDRFQRTHPDEPARDTRRR